MAWLLFALGGYLCNAASTTVDTVLLRRSIPQPVRYAAYVGLASIFALVLAPWGFAVPPTGWIGVSVLTGLTFIGSLAIIFRFIQRFEPSRAVPVYGAVMVVVLFAAERYLLSASFSPAELLAAGLLLAGTFLLAYRHGKPVAVVEFAVLAAAAGAASALYFFLAKIVFTELGFVNGFIWTRMAAFAGAVVLWCALRRSWRSAESSSQRLGLGFGTVVLANRLVAGVGSVFVNAAVSLASPALVNALRGVEYGFLFLIALGLTVVAPKLLAEELRAPRLIEKIAGLLAVGAGLALLALGS